MLPNPIKSVHGWLVLLTAFLLSCHLGQDAQVVGTLSFTRYFDSLSQYDRVVIEVTDPEGNLDVVIFDAKVGTKGQLDNLEVPGWQRGPIVIFITGYRAGQPEPVYREERRFNPATRSTDLVIIHLHPHPTLSADPLTVRLTVGQRLTLPTVKVAPANLANPALQWTSDNPGIAHVDGPQLVGVTSGSTRLTVAIGAGADQKVVFTVEVEADLQAPSRLHLDPPVLRLAQDGASKRFTIGVEPAGASREVDWRIQDSTKVALRSDGAFTGLSLGQTWVYAASRRNASARDSGLIEVVAPVPVASVRFLGEDTLYLYLGGAPESLQVEVLPSEANQEVRFSLSDASKATLSGHALSAEALGGFTIRALSLEDSTKTDVLAVVVREAVRISGVKAADQQVTLYMGGPGRRLSAEVLPSEAPQGVRWKSLSPTNVSVGAQTGEIAPLQPGLSLVVATSQADTSARDTVEVSVKADVPRVTLEASDTLVSAGTRVSFQVTIEQEFGDVVMMQWDLDGDGAYEDSAKGNWTGTKVQPSPILHVYTRPGPVTARVRVRDSEGYTGQAARSLRVVGGSAVAIESPKHNSQTNQRTVQVIWSVNGTRQDSLTSETLAAEGPNVIRRSARDSLGKVVADSVTVHLDTTRPSAPTVSGTSPTNQKPRWTWAGGGGGSGEFRIRLGDGNFPADAPTRRDSAFVLEADPASGTTYTLFVQERDLAGNWSASGSRAIRYDVSKPVVEITAPLASGTHYTTSATATLSGSATGPLPITRVTYRLGAGAEAAATLTASGWTTPAITLAEGTPMAVTVTATDEAGNTGEASLTLLRDNTQPTPPTILTGPAAEISAVRGSFSWSAGSDGTAGSGLNGRYRYNVNGGAWTETSETLVADLSLASGNNTFAVQEQDRALNWSASASRVVRVDTAGPVITLTGQNPRTSASLTVTLSGTVRDSSGAPTMTVTGQVAGSSAVTVTGTSWSTATLTLASGPNTLVLTAADRLGNERTLSVTVNVNVPAPVVVITNPADSLTVTNQGSIVVSYTLDGGAAQTQTFTLDTDGVYRLVVSSPPSPSGNIGRDTVKVTRDMVAPNAPTLTRGATPTNGNASWNWTSNGDNTGGAGVRSPNSYRYSLNGGTTWTETGAVSHSIPTEGTHTLVVQERDKAGNWSANSTAQTIVVDKTPPGVAITWPTRDNYVTNQGTVILRYRVDLGVETQATCTLTVANGRNTCRARSADNAGNVGQDSLYVWRRSTVMFVTPAGAGLGNGNDWENAMSAATLTTAVGSASSQGKTFWMATGSYPALNATYNVTLMGGFVASGFPYEPVNRQPNLTILESFHVGNDVTATVDGFRSNFFSGGNSPTLNLRDVTIIPTTTGDEFCAFFFQQSGSTITATNLVVEDSYYTYSIFLLDGTLTLTGGSIQRNLTANTPLMVNGTTTLNAPLVIADNRTGDSVNGDYQARVAATGRLIVGRNVALSCEAAAGEVFVAAGGTCTNQ